MEISKILIVEDSQVDQMIIQDILHDFECISAYDGIEAFEMLEKHNDIYMIILDLNMPRMDGFEVLEKLKSDYTDYDVSVIILTNYEEIENEIRGLELGAVDYIRKPLNSKSLLKRIEVHLNLIHVRNEIRDYNQQLEEKVRIRTRELEHSRDITVNALLGLLEVRDLESSNHTKRTQLMMHAFASHLATKPEYTALLSPDFINTLSKTAPLHDIGKVGVRDQILLKPGKLTKDEYQIMKEHVRFGVEALTMQLGAEYADDFVHTAVDLIGAHHEKFDGSGYPNGRKGKDIPLAGRLMAIIDVYDALTSKRVYKEAYDHTFARNILIDEKGKHFDPDLVDAFLEIEEAILSISIKYKSRK